MKSGFEVINANFLLASQQEKNKVIIVCNYHSSNEVLNMTFLANVKLEKTKDMIGQWRKPKINRVTLKDTGESFLMKLPINKNE